MSKHVDLPAPFGPIRASISPAWTANETSRTAAIPSQDLVRFAASKTGSVAGCVRSWPRLRGGSPGRQRRQAPSKPPSTPCGKTTTSVTISRPRTPRQSSVWRTSSVLSRWNRPAPNKGPSSTARPPSITMTRASTDCGTASTDGNTLPRKCAHSPPARSGERARQGKAQPLHARHVNADRAGPHGAVAGRPQGVTKGGADDALHARRARLPRRRVSADNRPKPAARAPRARH